MNILCINDLLFLLTLDDEVCRKTYFFTKRDTGYSLGKKMSTSLNNGLILSLTLGNQV